MRDYNNGNNDIELSTCRWAGRALTTGLPCTKRPQLRQEPPTGWMEIRRRTVGGVAAILTRMSGVFDTHKPASETDRAAFHINIRARRKQVNVVGLCISYLHISRTVESK